MKQSEVSMWNMLDIVNKNSHNTTQNMALQVQKINRILLKIRTLYIGFKNITFYYFNVIFLLIYGNYVLLVYTCFKEFMYISM